MRLISCYIENFGKLREFSYVFDEGLNCIMQDNGWGKTTMAAFLKAMFYGMERTTKRSLYENERKKYEPWSGGAYGGNLVFEAEGKEYRIERFFGGKDKEDIFRLYDLHTGLESNAYTENIGEELFGIDKVAFEQSIFLKQGAYEVTLTDGIAAKMSGLMAGQDDLDCYEAACARLESEMKNYKKIGNKGKIPEITEEIAAINRRLIQESDIEVSLENWREEKVRCRQALEEYRVQKEELKQRILLAGEAAALQEKHKYYNMLRSEKDALAKALEELDRFFGNGVPEEEETEDYRNKIYRFFHMEPIAQAKEKSYRYPNLVRSLEQNPVTEEELDACLQRWKRADEEERLLERKEMQLKNMEAQADRDAQVNETGLAGWRTKRNMCVAIMFVFLVVAVVLYFTAGIIYAAVALAVSAFVALGIPFIGMQMKKCDVEDLTQRDDYVVLEEECEILSSHIDKSRKAVRMYLQAFSLPEEDVETGIERLRYALTEMNVHREAERLEQDNVERRQEEKKLLREDILLFLRRYYADVAEVDELLIKEIEQKRNRYLTVSQQYEEKCRLLEAGGEMETTVAKETLSVGELQERETILELKIKEQEHRLKEIHINMEACEEQIQENKKLQDKKSELEELLEECRCRYSLLEKTLEYLKQARNEFSSRYVKKMNEGFRKYTSLLEAKSFDNMDLDGKLNIRAEVGGRKRELGYYSEGMRESVNLCTRFALIDALFEKETPFIILDDPFVNLDVSAMEGAKKVLDRLAKEYQLIYFTCHPSRQ